MKVGIIAPISMLNRYCTTEFQYCLPSLLLESEKYRTFYTDSKRVFTILDTVKLGWRREPEDPDIIEEVLSFLTPDLTILPSYMYDVAKTVRVSQEFLVRFKPKYVAGCLEGASTSEIKECKELLGNLGIGALTIPSHLYSMYKGNNLKAPTIFIENHLKLEEIESPNGILVTSLPVRLGLQGRLISDYLPSPHNLTFYEEEDNFPDIIERNIKETLIHYEHQV